MIYLPMSSETINSLFQAICHVFLLLPISTSSSFSRGSHLKSPSATCLHQCLNFRGSICTISYLTDNVAFLWSLTTKNPSISKFCIFPKWSVLAEPVLWLCDMQCNEFTFSHMNCSPEPFFTSLFTGRYTWGHKCLIQLDWIINGL